MPTSRHVTPHRVLPVILAIPLLLIFLSIRGGGHVAAAGLFAADGPFSLSHRLPIPIPWEDDVFTTGLPTSQQPGKRLLRKPLPLRIFVLGKPPALRRRMHTGPQIALFSPLAPLMESLLLSRPPPAARGCGGTGGGGSSVG